MLFESPKYNAPSLDAVLLNLISALVFKYPLGSTITLSVPFVVTMNLPSVPVSITSAVVSPCSILLSEVEGSIVPLNVP